MIASNCSCMHGLGSVSLEPIPWSFAAQFQSVGNTSEQKVLYVTGSGVRLRSPFGDVVGSLPKGTRVTASVSEYGVPGVKGPFRAITGEYGTGPEVPDEGGRTPPLTDRVVQDDLGVAEVNVRFYPLMSSAYLSETPPPGFWDQPSKAVTKKSSGSGKTPSGGTKPPKGPVKTAGPSNVVYFLIAAAVAYAVASRMS